MDLPSDSSKQGTSASHVEYHDIHAAEAKIGT